MTAARSARHRSERRDCAAGVADSGAEPRAIRRGHSGAPQWPARWRGHVRRWHVHGRHVHRRHVTAGVFAAGAFTAGAFAAGVHSGAFAAGTFTRLAQALDLRRLELWSLHRRRFGRRLQFRGLRFRRFRLRRLQFGRRDQPGPCGGRLDRRRLHLGSLDLRHFDDRRLGFRSLRGRLDLDRLRRALRAHAGEAVDVRAASSNADAGTSGVSSSTASINRMLWASTSEAGVFASRRRRHRRALRRQRDLRVGVGVRRHFFERRHVSGQRACAADFCALFASALFASAPLPSTLFDIGALRVTFDLGDLRVRRLDVDALRLDRRRRRCRRRALLQRRT